MNNEINFIFLDKDNCIINLYNCISYPDYNNMIHKNSYTNI
jgi:hypothetical protein